MTTDLLRKIKVECARNDQSVTRFLKSVDVNPSLYWKWKTGKVSPTIRSLEKIERGLRSFDSPIGRPSD